MTANQDDPDHPDYVPPGYVHPRVYALGAYAHARSLGAEVVKGDRSFTDAAQVVAALVDNGVAPDTLARGLTDGALDAGLSPAFLRTLITEADLIILRVEANGVAPATKGVPATLQSARTIPGTKSNQ